MTKESGETHSDASTQKRSEDSEEFGRRYRFDHLALRLVLRDMYYSRDNPGTGDRVPDFDLAALGGGRFRSSDLGETGPALLIFGSYTCPQTDSAVPGLKELHARFGDRVRFTTHASTTRTQGLTLTAKRAALSLWARDREKEGPYI